MFEIDDGYGNVKQAYAIFIDELGTVQYVIEDRKGLLTTTHFSISPHIICHSIDARRINILVRDINGKRETISFKNVEEFHSFSWDNYSDENYEILLVEWGNHCIYSMLSCDYNITIEELVSFFA